MKKKKTRIVWIWFSMLLTLGLEIRSEEAADSEGLRSLQDLAGLADNLCAQGDYTGAQLRYEEVLETSRRILGNEHPDTLAALANLASSLHAQGDYTGSELRYEELLETSRRVLGADHPDTLTTMAHRARNTYDQGNFAGAKLRFEELLEASSRVLGAEHPDTLTAMANLGAVLHAQGNFSRARSLSEKVLEVRHRVLGAEHPDTLAAEHNFTASLCAEGDYFNASLHYKEVLEARRRVLGEEHPDTLTAIASFAAALKSQGDFTSAKPLEEKVLDARRRTLGDEHLSTLTAMGNLAITLKAQGDFANARLLEEEVIEIRRRVLGDTHPDTLAAMASLAYTLNAQGNPACANQLEKKVLEARICTLGAEHPDTLTAMANLAIAHKSRGNLLSAMQLQKKVLEARRRIFGAEHPDTLMAMAALAESLYAQADFSGARHLYREVLEARRRILGGEHPDTLATMHNLSHVLNESGHVDAAQQLLEQILEIQRRARPFNQGQIAETLCVLAEIHRDAGRPEVAGKHFLATLNALEAQSSTLDFSEDEKMRFRMGRHENYKASIGLFLEEGNFAEAFHILERYRSQSLLTLMRWGESLEADGLSPEIDSEVQDIARRLDLVTKALKNIDRIENRQRQETLRAEQAQLHRRLEVLRGIRIRSESDAADWRLVALRPEAARRQLDPGTVMLAYNVGHKRVDLFVLTKDGPLEVHSLSVSELEIQRQLTRFLPLLLPVVSDEGPTSFEEFHETADPEARTNLGLWLYDRLLAPASERLVSAKRLLILPDGPLHNLPFNTLIRPAPDDDRGWQYLVEWKPIHIAQSATVYAELQKRRRSPASDGTPLSQTLVALGNPKYPSKRDNSATKQATESKLTESKATKRLPFLISSAENRGIFEGLTPLPNTQREVTEIAKLFTQAKSEASTYLGTEATEERAKAELANARYIHLAAHGVVDPYVPDNSFIALTIPEGLPADRENGILQAWEIKNILHLDADLVVLSACVTALGPNQGGEGLMSLSRAFQIAGARTVAASLWPVADDSTAELMIRFYHYLLAGKPKDEALRAAQMELIAAPIEYVNAEGETVTGDFRAPYHWAAFQLIGDWQ